MKLGFNRLRSSLAVASLSVVSSVLGVASCDDGTGGSSGTGVRVQISGEDAAVEGFPFPLAGEVALADGWELTFTHVLVSVDHVTLSLDPDLSPSDQSQTGAAVARLDGPWIVDLSKEGDQIGAGGEGKAILLGEIADQNLAGNEAFDPTLRYAFGFDLTAPAASAKRVNLDAEAGALADEMAAKGYSVLYVGKATFKGGTACKTSDATYDYTAIPTTIDFSFGFATPAQFINCQNENNDGQPFDGEEFQRGVAIPTNQDAVAQITMHLEHPFFIDVVHDSALHFDAFAAQATAGAVLRMDDLVGVDPKAVTDKSGKALPWRTCDDTPLASGTQMQLGTGSIPVDPAGQPATGFRDLRDFVDYVQSTQGHLNGGEGLCFVKRAYPSPP